MRTGSIVALLSILIGCAHQPAYVAPTDGPLAKIQFVNLAQGTPTTILFYEDGIACKGMRRLSFYDTNYSDSSIAVSANRPFTFTIDHSTMRSFCRQTYMFTPDARSYRVRTDADAKECAFVVERNEAIDAATPRWIVVQDVIEREYKAPFLASGEWCKPLAEHIEK